MKISGFDFGNSPLEYTAKNAKGKTLILCTTNGTQAILKARDASRIFIAALSNISAAAKKAAEFGDDISIICAGTKERFSADDILTAGALTDRLAALDPHLELDDLAMVSQKMYVAGKDDKEAMIAGSYHVEFLRSLNMQDDIDFCLQEDTADIVPVFSDGIITL